MGSHLIPPGASADQALEWSGPSGRLVGRVYLGATPASRALLVFFPPGGFAVADLDASDACLKEFAVACKVTVLAPSYAVAPEHPFPAAVEDAHALLTRVAGKRSLVGGWTGEHLFVGGLEAGGNLAAVAALMCRDRLGPRLSGQVLLMPMLDPSMTVCTAQPGPGTGDVMRSMSDAYRGYLPRMADRVHPYACPLQSSRMAGLPPALLIDAEGDPLAAEARAYADKLQHAGVSVQRVSLPRIDMEDADARCTAAGERPCVAAIAAFIASIVAIEPPTRPARKSS
jgi:acetyl esterase